MRIATVSSLVAFGVSAAGIVITSPRQGEKVDFSKPITIHWQRVSTDPSTVDIVLVNQDVYPPVTETVASGVDVDKGSYTIKAHDQDVSTTDTGGGYQVNFLAPSGGILAQSQQFKVTDQKAELASSSGSSITSSSTSMSTKTHTTSTTTTTKHMKSTMTSTATATTNSNAAGIILPPNQAGSLLLGLVALVL